MAESPYSVGYPVNFRSGGDTTRDAFRKHMDEIERIYGILNALNAGKVSSAGVTSAISSAISEHVNSSTPHPNWRPSYSFSEITGSVDASRVSGRLTGATIDYGKVNGLRAYIEGMLPSDKGDGIKESTLGDKGYVKFGNGLMLQWGKTGAIFKDGVIGEYKYDKAFSSVCYALQLTYEKTDESVFDDTWCQLLSYDLKGFKVRRQADDNNTGSTEKARIQYLAIGQ